MRGRQPVAARTRATDGFTLVEVVVVLAIVGVLTAAAVVFIAPSSRAGTARGFADEISAYLDAARERALSRRTWQRITIEGQRLVARQASITGFVAPADDDDCPAGPIDPAEPSCWMAVGSLSTPSGDVAVRSTDDEPHLEPGSAPAPGVGLPLILDFAPDGASTGTTLFVGDQDGRGRARVLVFSVTGAVIVYDRW